MVRIWIALVCAAVMVVAGCGEPNGSDPEADARAVIDDAFATFNAGDYDAWVEVRDRGASHASEADRDETLALMRDRERSLMEDGGHYEEIECESHGDGSWPVAEAGDVDGWYFTCRTHFVFGDGWTAPETFEWVVADGDVVAVRSSR